MNIQFCGGAQTVTGSQHLLSVNGARILLECGLFQGRRKESYEINKSFLFEPAKIDALVLSHAHIDHCGNIPNLVRHGFQGPVYATSATVDLCKIMLLDSAYLQEKDAEWVNRIRERHHEPPIEPLYTAQDVEQAMRHFIGLPYGRPFEIAPGVSLTFRDAGHILGSAGILLEIRERNRNWRFGFSGDIGRKDMPILRDPDQLRDLDLFITECTYGNRLHAAAEDVEEDLAQTVRRVVDRGGKIIIPAFALGRTQLLVYLLHKLYDQNRIPDIPVFVDSPLATSATEVFRLHPECFDRETYRLFLEDNQDPFGFRKLRFVRSVEASKKLNEFRDPCVIISASGMAEAGRILHHLKNNIGNPKNLVLLVGYAAEHTLARKLRDGWEEVKIFGEPYKVRCEVKAMDAFSAHADRRELLDYFDTLPADRLRHVFLVHGEKDQALPFKQALESKGYRAVYFPARGDRVTI